MSITDIEETAGDAARLIALYESAEDMPGAEAFRENLSAAIDTRIRRLEKMVENLAFGGSSTTPKALASLGRALEAVVPILGSQHAASRRLAAACICGAGQPN